MHQPSIFVSSGLFAALFAAALLPAPAAFGFTFAKDGKASAAIVLPKTPDPRSATPAPNSPSISGR